MSDTLITVDHISKKFCRDLKTSLWYGLKDITSEMTGRKKTEHSNLRDKEFWALKDLSFEVKRGECLGLIGRNGAGKSTILKILNGLIKPDTGKVEIFGSVGALIELSAGFNPILTGRDNIYNSAAIRGFSKKETDFARAIILNVISKDRIDVAPGLWEGEALDHLLFFSLHLLRSYDIICFKISEIYGHET